MSRVPEPWLLNSREFEEIRALAHRTFGLELKPGKEALVAARLGKRLREGSFQTIREYLDRVREDPTGSELRCLIDALTTNHTSFLREPQHFDYLRKVILPALRNRRRVEIWSAACSTGEEPYSILFHVLDELGLEGADRVSILATDISTKVLAVAERGIYPLEKLSELPAEWLPRYFQRGSGREAGRCRVKPALAGCVRWQRLNLMEPLGEVGRFPVIFCRNVMIYFDKPTQQRLVAALTEQLESGGHLLIGHSEGLMGIHHALRYVAPATYRRSGAPEDRKR